MDVLLIVNEKAGNGKGRKVWESISSSLTFKYDYVVTQYSGHAVDLARQAGIESQQSGRQLLIVAIGGDGTIHEVISGIAGMRHVTVGGMKAGSGNDFARGFISFKHSSDIVRYVERHRTGNKIQLAASDRRNRKNSHPYAARKKVLGASGQTDGLSYGWGIYWVCCSGKNNALLNYEQEVV